MPAIGLGVCLGLAWVGHAALWLAVLNHVYGRPWPKRILKPIRLACGLLIVLGPCGLVSLAGVEPAGWPAVAQVYLGACLFQGAVVLPFITWRRARRRPPAALLEETHVVHDFYPALGRAALGHGHWAWIPRLPGTDVFRMDFTRLTVALPDLPPAWEGLELLILGDLHFHGTPSWDWFAAVQAELIRQGPVDAIFCTGDLVDRDSHRDWIPRFFEPLPRRWGAFGVLGNHDEHHEPQAVRAALQAGGVEVLGNLSRVVEYRGVLWELIGHEGPWFGPPPLLGPTVPGRGRWMIAHTPDAWPFAVRHQVSWMVAGHVHGGQIRLPGLGSLFVPSQYGRRYDQGLFQIGPTTLLVTRGVSGKEPLRYRCTPQIVRCTLRRQFETRTATDRSYTSERTLG